MPRIFDNIDQQLLPALRDTLAISDRADFCVGYFNLRGWKQIDELVERWSGGAGSCCRLLVGMQSAPAEELRQALSIVQTNGEIDNQTALRFKKRMASDFAMQLGAGVPTNRDEAGLRRLAAQIRAKKVVVKLFLRHTLHAKLYLLFRPDPISPTVGYLGSSNLTFAGLAKQGELNVDVVDHDACQKLAHWFDDRWNDRWCIDISSELAEIIEQSWARREPVPPYHIYLKMAFHLSKEALEGIREFRIPREFAGKLFDFQEAAVKFAAQHLNKRGGVLLGDVVGLGKTITATALARMMELDHGISTLILCPKNLVPMWTDYAHQYGVPAKIVSFSRVSQELPNVPARFRLVLIDESHNLRNREGKRYQAIREYIEQSASKVVLLSATPYNKSFLDLANQLRLFLSPEEDLGILPETLLREKDLAAFESEQQCKPRTLAAFEKSPHVEDWRELMRHYLVRRTRQFIEQNYATRDDATGRMYLTFPDGRRFYFPRRVPCRRAALDMSELHKGRRTSFRKLRLGTEQAVFGLVHGLDIRNYDAAKRQEFAHELANQMELVKSRCGHNRLVLMGDFNMNPFDDGMNLASGLNAMMTKACIASRRRTYSGKQYDFYYNPMWSLFGDGSAGPADLALNKPWSALAASAGRLIIYAWSAN